MHKSNYRCSIIADPEGKAWKFAEDVLKYLQDFEKKYLDGELNDFIIKINPLLEERFSRDSLKEKRDFARIIYDCMRDGESMFELNELNVKRFRDSEIRPKIKRNIRGDNCFVIHDSNSDPLYWFTSLILINHALRNSSAHEIINVVPYLKFSRQDVKDESRVPISAKVVADILNHDHTRLLTMDVHNPAIQGFYNIPFDSLYSFPEVVRYIKNKHPYINLENLVIATPDEGGVKRARAFSKKIGARGIAVVDKYRLIPGELGGSLGMLGDIRDCDVLFVDDIVDSGRTLTQGSNIARVNGANKVYAYATHGLFTEGYEQVLSCFDKFFIGNTLAQPDLPKLEVINFEELFAKAMYRTNIGDSLSALFD